MKVDFLNASRFPVRDRQAMSLKHHFGNLMLSLAMSILYFRWVRDSQSGMWVFRRSILKDMHLEADGMAFSEEIKIEALKNPRVRFGEISIMYTSRIGEKKLNPWRDGLHNLLFLVKKRLPRRKANDDGRRCHGRWCRYGTGANCWNALLCGLRAQTAGARRSAGSGRRVAGRIGGDSPNPWAPGPFAWARMADLRAQ